MAARVRGQKVAMISQDPMTSLNPVYTVGDQVSGPFLYHKLVKTAREALRPQPRRACVACAFPRPSSG